MVCNMYTELKDEKLKQKVLKNLTIRMDRFHNFYLIRPIKYITNEKYIIIIYLNILYINPNLHIDIEYSVFSSPFKFDNFWTCSEYNFFCENIILSEKDKYKLEKITFKTVVELSLLKESFYDLKYDFDCDTSKKLNLLQSTRF